MKVEYVYLCFYMLNLIFSILKISLIKIKIL
nr:MAG TPA: hypothetical protein [Caudoviricetes sp.]